MSDLIDTARQQIDRYGYTTKGTSLALVNEMQQLEACLRDLWEHSEYWTPNGDQVRDFLSNHPEHRGLIESLRTEK